MNPVGAVHRFDLWSDGLSTVGEVEVRPPTDFAK